MDKIIGQVKANSIDEQFKARNKANGSVRHGSLEEV